MVVASPSILLFFSTFYKSSIKFFQIHKMKRDICTHHFGTDTSFHFYDSSYNNPPIDRNNGANTNDTTVISLIRMLIEGPDVSLNGSPTVSPTTAAL